ncbi:MAG: SRPBCC domain-containing protein [Dehalococcoidia bacterium]|nr:SRPBCC domain-containing protein [Dehalococcoidia bacterium]
MGHTPLGSVSTLSDGLHELRFERDLPCAPEAVWNAVTSPDRIGDWLSEAEVDLRPADAFGYAANAPWMAKCWRCRRRRPSSGHGLTPTIPDQR